MGLDILAEKGVPLDRQVFTWREHGGSPVQQAGRRRVHARARHPDERHRVGGGALQPRLRAHEPRPAARRSRGCGASSSTSRRWSTGSTRRPVAARDDHRLRAGRDRGDRRARAAASPTRTSRRSIASACSRTSTTCTATRRCMDRARGQGREQHPPVATPTSVPGGPPRSSTALPRTTCARRYDRATARADHEAQRAHPHGRRAPDARLLHERRADVRRPGRAPALRRDRLDRGAARHAVRVAHRSRRDLAREVAAARGDRGLQLLELPAAGDRTRASRRSGSASSTTSSATCTS